MKVLHDVVPDSGVYLKEADYVELDFQKTFWGSNYPRLYQLKQEYDPRGVFYVHEGVGSEDWYVEDTVLGMPSQNSRLFRKT